MAKIGFIGTGIMGRPMAQNLQKAGHSLFLSTHHDAAPADLVAAGAVALANPKEVAQEAEFIIVMVPDTPQVEAVMFGENVVDLRGIRHHDDDEFSFLGDFFRAVSYTHLTLPTICSV